MNPEETLAVWRAEEIKVRERLALTAGRRARCGANARPTGREPVRRYGAQAHRANVIGGISYRRADPADPVSGHSGRPFRKMYAAFSLEHSELAYRFDLGIFGGASTSLAVVLVLMGPRAKAIQIIAYAALGLACRSAGLARGRGSPTGRCGYHAAVGRARRAAP
jgi:hypothetical protein